MACSSPRSEAEADQLLRECDLLGEAGLDRGDDVVAKGGIEGHAVRDREGRAATSPDRARRDKPSGKANG